ncbi:hypothetical protein BH10PLA2_BH10PLA2_24840 [soil metagenome]
METETDRVPSVELGEHPEKIMSQSTRPMALRDVPWTWRDVLIGVAPLVILRVLHELPWKQLPSAFRLFPFVLNCLVIGWTVGCPLWILRRKGGRLIWPSAKRVVIEAAISIPVLLLIWLGLFVVMLLFDGLASDTSGSNPMMSGAEAGNWKFVIYFTVFATICAPLAEETLFRGMLYNFLRIRIHIIAAAVIQAILFGLMHTFGATHSVVAGLLGFALALVYEWRRTLLTPMFVHFLQNLMAGLLALAVAIQAANTPMLGVGGIAKENGVLLQVVDSGSAAAEAGLQENDILTVLDGYAVKDVRDIRTILSQKQGGDKVWVEFIRDKKPQRVEVLLKPR